MAENKEYVEKLENALSDILDGTSVYDLNEMLCMGMGRAEEIESLMTEVNKNINARSE